MLKVCVVPNRWWSFIILGAVFLALGIISLVWTTGVMYAISLVFTGLMFFLGLLCIVLGILSVRLRIASVPLFVAGFFFILTGAVSVTEPALLATVAMVLLAAFSILIGLVISGYGIISFMNIRTRSAIVLLGIIPVVIGVYILLNPGSAAFVIVKLWGVFALILGGYCISQGLMMRRVSGSLGCNIPEIES